MRSIDAEIEQLRLEYADALTNARDLEALLSVRRSRVIEASDGRAAVKRLNSPGQLFVPFALERAAKIRTRIKEIDGEIAQRRREIRAREQELKDTKKEEQAAQTELRKAKADLAEARAERDRRNAALDAFRENNPNPRSRLGRSGVFEPELRDLLRAKIDQKEKLRRLLNRVRTEQNRLGDAIKARVLLISDIRLLRSKIQGLIRKRKRLLNS